MMQRLTGEAGGKPGLAYRLYEQFRRKQKLPRAPTAHSSHGFTPDVKAK